MARLKTEAPVFREDENAEARVQRLAEFAAQLRRELDFVLSHLGGGNVMEEWLAAAETDPTVPAWAKEENPPTAQEVGALPEDTPFALSAVQGGAAVKTAGIPCGTVDAGSTSTAFTATVPGITSLYDGVCVYLQNGVVSSASGWTLDVNGLGAKPVYQTMAAASRITTAFNVAYTMLFVYNASRVEGGCWDMFYGYNTNSDTLAYNIRRYQSDGVMHEALYRYMLAFTRRDGTLQPANTESNTTGNAKTLTTESFDPWQPIFYYTTTATVEAGESPSASYMYTQYGTADLRYAFNSGKTLTAKAPVYIKCSPQADGAVKLAANDCIVQELPSTEDGYVYIYLGRAYDTYRICMDNHKPVYEYAGGKIRLYTGA